MAFELKDILSFILDPKILAAVGGWAAYTFVGKKKPGRYTPYLYAGGGAVGGWLLGKAAQSFLVQQPKAVGGYAPYVPSGPAQVDPRVAELRRMTAANQKALLDLDAAARMLPATPTMPPEEAHGDDAIGSYKPSAPISVVDRKVMPINAASIAPEDMEIIDSKGSYGGSLDGDGLGSFSDGGDDIDAAVDAALREEKSKRGRA